MSGLGLIWLGLTLIFVCWAWLYLVVLVDFALLDVAWLVWLGLAWCFQLNFALFGLV